MSDYSQLGLFFDGDATTNPGAAPVTFAPLAPILFSTPCNAIGPSDEMKLFKEPVERFRSKRRRELIRGICVKKSAAIAMTTSETESIL